MKNLDKYVNDSYRLSLDECFGTWIHNGVWQSDESLTFKENKEVFFLTLKKLLDDNKVVFFPPEPNSKIKKYKYCSNGEYYVDSGEYEEELWDETSENIIPVSCSTQPISGQVSYQKSVNLMSFSLVISLGNMSLI
jgi:hypothetical protein